jgi:hypothetical protein
MSTEELLQQLLDQAATNHDLLLSISQSLTDILGILKILVYISGVFAGLFMVNLFAKAWLKNGV